jgi:cytoskeletal protein CcmA (bactofilin family)
MLGINSNKNKSTDISSVNLIGEGTKIVGDINSDSDIRIDGQLTGNIITKGKFVLGESGFLDGNVISLNADISGEIKGKIEVSEMLSLKRTAKINGDILTSKLAIEPGALFTGTCNMGAKVKNILQNTDSANAKTA